MNVTGTVEMRFSKLWPWENFGRDDGMTDHLPADARGNL